MPAGYIYWTLMILWALFGCGVIFYPDAGGFRRGVYGGFTLLLFVLLFIIGYRLFGSVVQ